MVWLIVLFLLHSANEINFKNRWFLVLGCRAHILLKLQNPSNMFVSYYQGLCFKVDPIASNKANWLQRWFYVQLTTRTLISSNWMLKLLALFSKLPVFFSCFFFCWLKNLDKYKFRKNIEQLFSTQVFPHTCGFCNVRNRTFAPCEFKSYSLPPRHQRVLSCLLFFIPILELLYYFSFLVMWPTRSKLKRHFLTRRFFVSLNMSTRSRALRGRDQQTLTFNRFACFWP